jgi:hypothetical protein
VLRAEFLDFLARRKKKRASNEPITFWLDTAVRGKATAVSHSSEAPRASEVGPPETGDDLRHPPPAVAQSSCTRRANSRHAGMESKQIPLPNCLLLHTLV